MDQLDPRRWLTGYELIRARAAFVRAIWADQPSPERTRAIRRQEADLASLWLSATRESGWQEATDVERQAVANRFGFYRWLRDQERLSDAADQGGSDVS